MLHSTGSFVLSAARFDVCTKDEFTTLRKEKKKSHFRRKDAFWKVLLTSSLKSRAAFHLFSCPRPNSSSLIEPVLQILPRRVCLSCVAPWGISADTEQTHQRSVVPLLVLEDISCGSILVLMELLPQLTWLEPFVAEIPHSSPALGRNIQH